MRTSESNSQVSTSQVNDLKRDLLVAVIGGGTFAIAEAIGERKDSVSLVARDRRPCQRTRRKVADYIAGQVYEIFGVERDGDAAAV